MKRAAGCWRSALLLGAASLLPATALANAAASTQLSPDSRFEPPAAPMILTRTLRRPLPDGNEVLTRRSYEIRFLRESDGFRVDGDLVSTDVEAPAELAALSAIERARPDTGLFPMRIDRTGMLQPMAAAAVSSGVSGGVRQAAAQGRRMIDAGVSDASERAAARDFVRNVADSAGRSQWPRDLFRPRAGYRREVQAMALPDGGAGNVTVEREAATRDAGLLASFARTITTELGGNIRRTYELWTLTPKAEN